MQACIWCLAGLATGSTPSAVVDRGRDRVKLDRMMPPNIKRGPRVLQPATRPLLATKPYLNSILPWIVQNGVGQTTRRPYAALARLGDKLYFWEYSCGPLCGDSGFAIVRDGAVIDTFTATIS